jgi:hypothetical protein
VAPWRYLAPWRHLAPWRYLAPDTRPLQNFVHRLKKNLVPCFFSLHRIGDFLYIEGEAAMVAALAEGKCQMTMVVAYPSKKELKNNIGKRLKYIETSLFGPEYKSNGVIYAANRPHITGLGREFFAKVTMENDLIKKVE